MLLLNEKSSRKTKERMGMRASKGAVLLLIVVNESEIAAGSLSETEIIVECSG